VEEARIDNPIRISVHVELLTHQRWNTESRPDGISASALPDNIPLLYYAIT